MSSFSEEIDREIEERIAAIESPDYEFPKRFNKADWTGIAVLTAVCLIGSIGVIIYGAGV